MIRKSPRLWDPPRQETTNRFSRIYTPASPEIVQYRGEMAKVFPPDPLVVKNCGLKAGDVLSLVAVHPAGKRLKGVQLSVSRGRNWLIWQSGMSLFGRDPSGKFIYTPYLETAGDAEAFISILSGVVGFEFAPREGCTSTKWTFTLRESVVPNRRLIQNDYVSLHNDSVAVSRQQGTLDMNLYRPGFDDGNIIFSHPMGFCRAPHHFKAVLSILTEANGLCHTPLNGGFLVTK